MSIRSVYLGIWIGAACVVGAMPAESLAPIGLSSAIDGSDPLQMQAACTTVLVGARVCTTADIQNLSSAANLPNGPWTAKLLGTVVTGVEASGTPSYVDSLGIVGSGSNCQQISKSASGTYQLPAGACTLNPILCCGTLPDGLFANGFE